MVAEGEGAYKKKQNTSRALSCSSVPLTHRKPPAPPTLTLTYISQTFSLSQCDRLLGVRPQEMASSKWGMNGLWRRMAGALVLCTLLLSSEVICQDDATVVPVSPAADATPVPDATISAATPGHTAAPDAGPTGDAGDASTRPEDRSFSATILNIAFQDEDTTAATARPGVDVAGAIVQNDNSNSGKNVGNDAADDAVSSSSSSGSSVFVGILVSGLLAALGITIGYFKCQRRPEKKAVKLAEEAYPADQDNQGNTLVSVAPLNPPPETPEKPSANGESTEAAKTQTPPPTNGHSTAKAADTEL